MQYKKDLIPIPKDFAFFYFNNAVGQHDMESGLHFHDCLEINYVVEGKGVNVVEENRFELEPGDFYVINNLERHMAFSPDNSLKMKIIVFDPVLIWQNNSFDYEYLLPFFNRSVYFSNCIKKSNPVSKNLLGIIKEIELEWEAKQEGYKLIIKALLLKLLALLYRHFKLSGEIADSAKSFHKSYDRIKDVVEYINTNFHEVLTLDKLAKKALMNKTYFCSYFKKVMQINILDYIQNLRINHACNLLRNTNNEIIDICEACGFRSVSHFNKLFKKYIYQTPLSYKSSQKSE